MERFRVMTVPEFVATGPAFGSREQKQALAAEQRARDEREALAQTRRHEYQARRRSMTAGECLQDEINMLNEWITESAKNTARVEADYPELTKRSGGDRDGSR